jgi:hypothetical protein
MQPVSPTPAERPLKPKRSQLFQTPSSQKRQPRARASAACEACKKRKTKCTGGPPPCQICESRGTGCVIDLSLDLRRRSALKHAQDQCKSYQDTLEGFIDCIRQGPSSLLDTLFESIKNAATTKDAVKTIQPHLFVVRSGKYDQAGPCQPEVLTSQNDSGDMDSFQGQVNELSDRAEYKLETTASLISTPQTPGKDAHIEYSAQISDLPEQLKTPISSDIALPGRTDYSQRYPALQMSSHVNPTADQVPVSYNDYFNGLTATLVFK